MGAPYTDLGEKGELALKAVLIAAASGIPDDQIFTSFSDDAETAGPAHVVINCMGGLEDGINSGNERLGFSIKIKSNADRLTDELAGTPRLRHLDYVARIVDQLKDTTLAALLSAAVVDFFVFNSITRRRGPMKTEDRKFVSEFILDFSCAPSDIG